MGSRSYREVAVATAQTRTQSRQPAGQPRQKVRLTVSGTRKAGAKAGSERVQQDPGFSEIGGGATNHAAPLQER